MASSNKKPRTLTKAEYLTAAVDIGESLARSHGRKADADERLADAAEKIAEQLGAILEMAASQVKVSADELAAGLAIVNGPDKGDKPDKPNSKPTSNGKNKSSKGATNGG